MTFSDLKRVWHADLYRYLGRADAVTLLRALVLFPGYRYTFAMRLCRFAAGERRGARRIAAQLVLRRLQYRFGITIPFDTEIGEGLYIGHFGGIVVSPHATIGRNCNLSPGVAIGVANRGRRPGAPRIGHGVYVGPGAKVIGAVTVGDGAAVGANAVVTRDVPPGTVVVGVPAEVVSEAGAAEYVRHTDY